MPPAPDDETVRLQHAIDHLATTARNSAPVVAAYYKQLLAEGVSRDDALVLAADFARGYYGRIVEKKEW